MTKIKYILMLIGLAMICCCSHKSFTQKLTLKKIPSVVFSVNEAEQLRKYEVKFSAVNIENIISHLESKTEKDKFKYRLLDFEITYNKCVDTLKDLEKEKEKEKKKRELQELLTELESIWLYLIVNYKI